ncbi:RagB/SusD family nutrient uptake outer membrane protein [Bacteroides sp.]|uniref:RagB/SusD family nutrient uptake outer membrane protein n=1 Tax=Bacteroides sp. TaxID=29523 RepID=UPI0023D3AB27|nr:RagB/SusD family nutrient uptake outer membrane protein [Bacteroides sp.]MDE5710501.1 RagB/SusD family nutrient uptake outer membrane protein [Bacteroides sp.]MDE5761648.1 RagB/SusD family nutrient uptake outer membrane protein [Bacteroides sp.]MDE6216607.1 RagB/SusD family nutrient uptake outer membrane protein [Bacteroides sp.]
MKKFIYLAGLCLTMSFASCDDFLTVSSPDQLTTGNFWRDQKDAEATLASAYAQLYHGDSYATSEVRWPVEEFRTDLYDFGYDATNYQTWTDIYKFTYTNGNTQFSYYYQDLYRGINFANQVLEYAPQIPEGNISEAKRSEIIAEAHFLRGYYHLMLVLNWEKIIIRNNYLSNAADLNKPLSDRVTCWDFVIDELKLGAALPATRPGSELGRATSGAANAYLGFAYLTRAYEEPAQESTYLANALTALNAVTGYELVSGEKLIQMFNGKNKNCAESIFELQYSNNTDNGARYYSWIHQFIACSEMGGWDEILPNTRLMDEFKKEGRKASDGLYDQRLYNTIYFKDDYFNDAENGELLYGEYTYNEIFWSWRQNINKEYVDANGNVIKIPAGESTYEYLESHGGVKDVYDRPNFRRFTVETTDELDGRCTFNIPLMRYANVMLMKAEVLNKQGYPEQAIPLINEVRAKHGNMPAMTGTTQAEVQAQIEHERIIEFPLESYRWYDLRRWGKLSEAVGNRGYVKGTHDFFPIPLWEINANPALNDLAQPEE